MTTLFTKIINKEIPSFSIFENEKYLSFLTIEPIHEGHTLLIPKREVDKWTDLDETEISELFILAKELSKKLEVIFSVKRVSLIISGFMVPHVHIHLIPSMNEDDISFSHAKKESLENLKKIQEKILTFTDTV